MQNVETMKKELWAVRHRHFLARSHPEKKELRKEDKALREKLAKALEHGGGFDTTSAKLMAAWDPYDQNTSADFSDPEWMFNVRDGFDVVIGNPPYVQIQKLPEDTKEILTAQKYKTFSKSADMYCLFYERGGMLLSSTGNLCYISSNKFFRSGYGKPLRQVLTQTYSLHRLIDFGELPVFEAGTDPVIMQFGKIVQPTFTAATIKDAAHFQSLREVIAETGRQMDPSELSETGWTLGSKASAGILDKMRRNGKPLGEYVKGEIYRGVLTGFNQAFILNNDERDALIADDPKSAEIIKPLAKGDDVRKWHVRNKGRWIILTKIGTDMKRYPAIFAHLKKWKAELEKREDQGNHWWELRACAYYDVFEKTKIVYPEIARESRFSVDSSAIFPLKTIFSIPSSDSFLLGVLNSRVAWHYLKNTCSPLGDPEKGGRLLMQAIYLETLPIPFATPHQQTSVSSCVDRILAAKQADPAVDTTKLEDEIDELVYDLYGLTPDEKKLVKESVVRGVTPVGVEDGEESDTGEVLEPKKKPTKPSSPEAPPSQRKRKAALPPSLPGWD